MLSDKEIQDLAHSVEDLKRAVKKNNPELRAMMSGNGWIGLAFMAGFAMALFCLPAQVLVEAYGGFDAIPAPWRAALWGALALILVLSGVWKMVLLSRKSGEIDGRRSLFRAMATFFTGKGLHITAPYFITFVAVSAFALAIGHPWFIVPAIAVPTCFYCNHIAFLIDRPAFLASGWWCLLSGLASLFFIEKAPFIWLFTVYGGFCFALGGALFLEARRSRGGMEDAGAGAAGR